MRDIAANPCNSAWFLNRSSQAPVLSLVDLSSCKAVSSSVLATALTGVNVSTGGSIAPVPCGGAYVSIAAGIGQNLLYYVLRSAAVAQIAASIVQFENVIAAAWDASNSRLALLTATQITEVTTGNLSAAWATNHGLTLSATGSIDADRNGNIVIGGGGQIQVYSGGTGTRTASASQTGVAFCRFDATGNIYAGGTSGLTKYAPGLASTLWTIATAPSALSLGDVSVWIEVDSGNNRSVQKLNPANGTLTATINNCMAPCAVPGDQAAAIQIAFGTLGPTICLISSAGTVTRTGDLIGAYQTITQTVFADQPVYTGTGPTIIEPGVGRIGANVW
jgi:hypothetical protein